MTVAALLVVAALVAHLRASRRRRAQELALAQAINRRWRAYQCQT